MVETFIECYNLQNLDLSGWMTSDNMALHSTWNNCCRLTSLDFGDGWNTARVNDFACAFWATAFDKLDLLSWDFDEAKNASGMLGEMKELREINISSLTSKTGLILKTSIDESMFHNTTNISRITVGDGLKWNDIRDTQNEATPSPVSPSGKWYSTTSGKAYDSVGLPDKTADTYISDTTLLPMKAFVVYSDTDKSLNLYKRHINEILSASDMYNERVVTRIYFDFEDSNPILDENPIASKYKRGYFHNVEEYVTNINIIDTCPNVMSIGGIFEQCTGLRNANMTNLYIPKANDLWFVFYNTKIPSIDLSTWTVGQPISTKSMFAGNRYLVEIKLPVGLSFANVRDAICMFDGCASLTLDCSAWDFPPNALPP